MPSAQRLKFEERLRWDFELRDEVETVRKVIAGIRGSEFKKMLADIHANLYGKSEDDLK